MYAMTKAEKSPVKIKILFLKQPDFKAIIS